MIFFCPNFHIWNAGIAQLVEYKLPKLGVASSNLVARSNLVIDAFSVARYG